MSESFLVLLEKILNIHRNNYVIQIRAIILELSLLIVIRNRKRGRCVNAHSIYAIPETLTRLVNPHHAFALNQGQTRGKSYFLLHGGAGG